jgi:hypothetical protein
MKSRKICELHCVGPELPLHDTKQQQLEQLKSTTTTKVCGVQLEKSEGGASFLPLFLSSFQIGILD